MYNAAATTASDDDGAGGAMPDDDNDIGARAKPKISHDLKKNIKAVNLCDDLDANVLTQIGRQVVDEYRIDIESRKAEGWDTIYEEGLKLARQVREDKNFPWANAANVKFPLITTAAIQFAARAYPAIVDGYNVVKGKVLGEFSDAKQAQATRIADHMSWQLLEQQPEWEEDTDQMLHMLPIVGTVFRKTWFDPVSKRNTSEIVLPDDMVVNYWSKKDAPRMTQRCRWYPDEILSKTRAGLWCEVQLGTPEGDSNDKGAPHLFLEQHRTLDLDDDGYPEPYIVTVHEETAKVVRICARYDEDGVTTNAKGEVVLVQPVHYYTKYVFLPSLDGGYYGTGFGALLNPINQTVDTLINQLMDAGTLSNMQSGFVGEGVQMNGGISAFKPGEWKRASVSGQMLKDSIVPLPVREPSETLFKLLTLMIEAGKDISAVKDIMTGETQGSNQAVGTTLAMIEQGLKVFTAIYKRLHRSLKGELKLNFRLNALYLPERDYFVFQDRPGVAARADYDLKSINVVPVSDPTVVTDMQRMARAQFLLTFRGQPGLDDAKINKRALQAASIDDIDSLKADGPPQPPPEFVIKGHELEIKEREQAMKDAQSKAQIGLIEAQTEQLNLATRMADPQFYATLRDMIFSILQEATGGQGNASSTVDAGQPGVGGMAQPAANPGVLSVPQGPSAVDGPEMGGGQPAFGAPAGGSGDLGSTLPA